jgi:hypothetical protein
MDSVPITAGDNYRIPRAKLSQHQEYRGYIASTKRYFYGLKLHRMVTKDGQPVECFLPPGSFSDVRALKTCQCDVPHGSHIDAAKAYYYNETLIDGLIPAPQLWHGRRAG